MNNKYWWTVGGVIAVVVIIGVIVFATERRTGTNNQVSSDIIASSSSPFATSTTNIPPVPVPPTKTSGPVGYIGCSNTWKSIEGYHTVGGTNMWETDSNYGGGDAAAWAKDLTDRNPYWAEFDKLYAKNPTTKTLWFQICAKKNLTYDQTYNDSVQVIAQAKSRIPGVAIYVSGLNGWDPVTSCNISGPNGGTYSDQTAIAIAQKGIALIGPVLSTIPKSGTTDGCHPNDASKILFGNELKSFFH